MASVVMTLPQTIPDTGIRHTLLEDLALKILFTNGELSLADLADRICLGLGAVEEIFQALRKQQLCEVKGMDGVSHRITTSAAGRMRASELFALNQYAGPAPVSLLDYTLRVQASTIERTSIRPELLARAFHPLLIDTDLFSRLGTAVVSGTSMFLYGPPGTGKTSIGSRIAAIYDDQVWIPYAVEVDNQILTVYDPGVHRKKEVPAHDVDDLDKRWVYCRRPCIIAGGELCAEMLDLQFNPLTRFCTAPLQMKANNGVLLLDDFGRQRMRPKELLNRWMTPLDRRVDFLTLPGGQKFEIPFDLFVVFSTNIDPQRLADEAFLRRIPNKIKVDYATPAQSAEIFKTECAARLLSCDEDVAQYFVEHITRDMNQPLCQCYSRDIINQICWSAGYLGLEPVITQDAIDRACGNYFVSPK